MSWLNPIYLSWGLVGFYVLLAGLWATKLNWPQVTYWIGAAIITAAVTKMS